MKIEFIERWNELLSMLPKGNPSDAGMEPTSWFGSYYIGPTSDAIMATLPTPVHAADYIAQQHDLEYQELGLNGISGTFSPESKEADARLIDRCNRLITMYDQGQHDYQGFAITEEAYVAAKFMREYFIVEETLSDFMSNYQILDKK